VIFVDTGAWFAALVPSDKDHLSASAWLERNRRKKLFTTDYIVDETLTLLRCRGEEERARSLGRAFFEGELAKIHYLSEAEIEQAWEVFFHFQDKEWSFTDCTSRIVIEKYSIKQAFAFDRHFRQFGSVRVVP
jgi:predicted nucleic acid-binding protein